MTDRWVQGADFVPDDPPERKLVCDNPKCRGAKLCAACRDLLDRYGEPGRA